MQDMPAPPWLRPVECGQGPPQPSPEPPHWTVLETCCCFVLGLLLVWAQCGLGEPQQGRALVLHHSEQSHRPQGLCLRGRAGQEGTSSPRVREHRKGACWTLGPWQREQGRGQGAGPGDLLPSVPCSHCAQAPRPLAFPDTPSFPWTTTGQPPSLQRHAGSAPQATFLGDGGCFSNHLSASARALLCQCRRPQDQGTSSVLSTPSPAPLSPTWACLFRVVVSGRAWGIRGIALGYEPESAGSAGLRGCPSHPHLRKAIDLILGVQASGDTADPWD